MTGAAASHELDLLRGRIDALDSQIMSAIASRLRCCEEVALYKRQQALPMMQPHRVAAVKQRAETFAQSSGIRSEFLIALYDLIIGECCAIEDAIIQ